MTRKPKVVSSKPYELGVVVGKFYPFHLGHHFVIQQAKQLCDRLLVIITQEEDERWPVKTRANWIASSFPDLGIIVTQNNIPDTPEAWAERTLFLVPNVSVVFTSEDYGPPWAEAMGVEHVHIDPTRHMFPVSGTDLRADLYRHWDFLPETTKAGLAVRVVIVGAESTGTTTLSKGLAEHYKTAWVPEQGREWWDARWFIDGGSTYYDFEQLLRFQAEYEDALAGIANRVLICDTDALATMVFEERYLGQVSRETRAFSEARRPDLYIITGDEIPWVNDGLRESEIQRGEMQNDMIWLVEHRGVPYLKVKGGHVQRMAVAIAEIDEVIEKKFVVE